LVFTSFLEDDKVFSSIMHSKRRFESLAIIRRIFDESGELRNVCLERLTQVIERFGKDIKELFISCIELPLNLVKLLNNMPKLEKIKFASIVSNSNKIADGEVKLHKLKKFESYECSADVLRIFNNLPPGVLRELHLERTDFNSDQVIQLFSNQHNITKIKADKNLARSFDWSQVKLKWLTVCDVEDLTNILKGQNELEYFGGGKVNEASLKMICNQLKSLVELHLDNVESQGIPELSKLRNLKILTIRCNAATNEEVNSFLSFVNSSSVEKLSIECWKASLLESTIVKLSSNFPHLRELRFATESSINILNTILHSFQNIVVLDVEPNFFFRRDEVLDEVITYQEGLKHEKLKKLKIGNWKGIFNKDLAKIIGCCTQLEELEMQIVLKPNDLREILNHQPNLKSLLLEANSHHEFSHEDISALKQNGKKLLKFNCSSCIFNVTLVKLREGFMEQFSFIEIEDCGAITAFRWEMKKQI
jgi:hypothetical protein